MARDKELTPHTVSVLAAVAQARHEPIRQRLIDLLDDEVAVEIAHELVDPSADSRAEVKQAAEGIRRWAENQRQPRKDKARYAFGS